MLDDPHEDSASPTSSPVEKFFFQLTRKYQSVLDKTVIYGPARWVSFGTLLLIYWLRVYFSQTHHIVTYGLHIYLLNLLIGFLSPAIDPETEGPVLPTKRADDEFRPFSRKLPEFKFWLSCFNGVSFSLFLTLFSFFDIPVFWPILLGYFITLFVLTMRRQIAHMIKHRYIPCNIGGKKKYVGGNPGGHAKTRDALNVP